MLNSFRTVQHKFKSQFHEKSFVDKKEMSVCIFFLIFHFFFQIADEHIFTYKVRISKFEGSIPSREALHHHCLLQRRDRQG